MTRRLLLFVAASLALAPPAAAADGMFVGAAEDAARSVNPVVAKTKMDLARLAGFNAVRLTSIWSPGETRPRADEMLVLRNAGLAAQLNGIRLILSVYHRDQRTTPLTARAQAQFAQYTASIAREVPGITDFIIGNEPNLNLFWMPQFTRTGGNAAAPAYLRLLARTYDALKAVSADLNVIGGSISPRGEDRFPSKRHTHSPSTFILDLGTAYRRSGRRKPVMDGFAFHPYLIPSRLPPTFTNPRNKNVMLSDYPKLVRLLGRAFDGTPQPGSRLPIVYDEFGYQSRIPAHKRDAYVNLAHPAAQDAIDEATQAAYYRQSLAIAQCQPNVTGMLLFHVSDEHDALRWQSGVYYADDTPKSSLPAVRAAALAAQKGRLARCPGAKRVNPVQEVVFPAGEAPEPASGAPPAAPGITVPPVVTAPPAAPTPTRTIELVCDQPCRYLARLERVHADAVTLSTAPALRPTQLAVAGSTVAGTRHAIAFATDPLAPGTYQYVLRVFAVGRPGTAVTRFSKPFLVEDKQPEPAPAPAPPAEAPPEESRPAETPIPVPPPAETPIPVPPPAETPIPVPPPAETSPPQPLMRSGP